MKALAKRVNRTIEAWESAGLTSNDLEHVKLLLERFNKDIGKNVKNPERASEQIHLTKKQKEEYKKVLYYILNNNNVDLSKRTLKNQKIRQQWNEGNEKTFNKVKKNYKSMVMDEQSFITFVDKMNMYKNNKVLMNLFDSHQIANIWTVGRSKGLKQRDLNNLLKDAVEDYEKNGITGDDAHDKIIKIIEAREKKSDTEGKS